MPDFDVDFCYERRQEVIDYVNRKYGADHVAQIVTFGTMAARGAIRDVGRALNIPYADVDVVAKQVPSGPGALHITLDEALKLSKPLRDAYEGDERIRTLIDTAKAIEGMPRHASTHAAGVVITRKPVVDYVPLAKNDESVVTQYVMTTLEELGLLKMDFLGLRNLTILDDTVRLVQKSRPSFSLADIPDNDPAVFQMLSEGRTSGVFQMESAGMTGVCVGLKPQNIEDITAIIALYRPGPMDSIPRFIACKHNPDKVKYKHPMLEPILSVTYGCIVYQEQVMQIVRDLAGYTLGRSDLVRRAMSKKKAAVMEKERQNFVYGNPEEGVKGCIANGIDEKTANTIYDEMIDFAKYAFNKSHAAAYAVVSYQTAYLKYYYPVEFMAALMTSVKDNVSKVSEYILTCRQMGMKIMPPDINEGEGGFSVSSGAIRYGLSAIKSIGQSVVDEIVKERTARGPFTSLENFIDRMSNKEVNKRTIESFIKSGALDSLPGTRKQKFLVSAALLDQKNKEKKNSMEGQMSLFDFVEEEEKEQFQITFPDVGEYTKEELLAFEKEMLGVYVSGHPLEEYMDLWKKNVTAVSSDFVVNEEEGTARVRDGAYVTIGGMITEKTVKTTRQNKMMAFITVEDLAGTVEVLIFPRDYEKNRELLIEDEKVFVQGRVSIGDDPAGKLICERITPFSMVPRELWLKYPDKEAYFSAEQELLDMLRLSEGSDRVVIYLEAERAKKVLPVNWSVSADSVLVERLSEKLGEKNVKVVEKTIEKIGKMN